MNTLHCSVTGIRNKQEKTRIKNALEKLEGVGKVGVNMMTSTIQVDFNPPATEQSIKSCIEQTGFTIDYASQE